MVPFGIPEGTFEPKKMNEKLLNKFLNDQCSEQELEQVIQWVKTNDQGSADYQLLEKSWRASLHEEISEKDENLISLLGSIHHKINQSTIPQKKTIRVSMITNWLTKAAAILLIPILSMLMYTITRPNFSIQNLSATVDSIEIIAPVGSKSILQLSDGTEVYLNHGSKLIYPPSFTGNTRDVRLYGEAYFKVAHNPEFPFVVHAKELQIKALGTEFNVLAYPEEDRIETTLVEGKVVLEKINQKGKIQRISELVPEQHVSYQTSSKKLDSSFGNIRRYTAWKDGKLVFKNDPISEISERLSRWYNIDIHLENKKLSSYTYTATFKNETLTQILDLMELATPIKYEFQDREKLANGGYSKQRIVIREK